MRIKTKFGVVSSLNLCIVTPIFFPSSGGASIYYNLLSKSLVDRSIVSHVTIVSERVPGFPAKEIIYNGKITVIRLFPNRAGARRQVFLQYIKYSWQNLLYVKLFSLIKESHADVLLVHTSFFNYPNLLSSIVRRISDENRCLLVADVRDWQLPMSKLYQLEAFDKIVACSENVMRHLTNWPALRDKLTLIPVVQETLSKPTQQNRDAFFKKYSLPVCEYISYVGLIKRQKGVELLVDAFRLLTKEMPNLHLILAGINKDPNLLREKMDGESRIHYLGQVSREEALILSYFSKLSANLSASEGMPRTSLEAIAMGGQVALPPNIPEFERHCLEHVVCADDAGVVAEQFQRLITSERGPSYPLEQHDVDNITRLYADIFEAATPYEVLGNE